MILPKIQKPFLTPLYFASDENFVWKSVVAYPNYVQPVEFDPNDFDFSDVNQTPLVISSVFVDGIEYNTQPTIALMRATEKSFFFDIPTQTLYIHIDHSKRMDSSLFNSTQIIGFTNRDVFYDENNIEYLPLVQSGMALRMSTDRFVKKKLSLINNTLTIDNKAGDVDFLIDNTVIGSDIQYMYISSEDLKEGKKGLTPLYNGYLNKRNINTDKATISIEDKRGQLNIKIPNNKYNTTDYPDLNEDNIDDLIYEGYGDIFNLPCTVLNGAESIITGDVLYKYGTDGTNLDRVQINVDDSWQTVTPLTTDPDNCEFTLSSATGRNSSGVPYNARVNCRLRDIKNPGSILVDMLFRYLGKPFDSAFFDIITWAEESSLLENVYLLMNKRDEFFIWIQELQNSSTLPFIFDITPDGKFTLKVDDITRAVSHTFDHLDNIDPSKNIDTDFDEYATEIKVNYKKNYDTEKYLDVTRDDFKQETLDEYRLNKELEFDSNLETLALAEKKAVNALKEYKIARPIVDFEIPYIADIERLDVIEIDCSVYIDNVKVREFAGKQKLKVITIDIDLDNETMQGQGLAINDIVSKGTGISNEGCLYNERLYNEELFGMTLTYEPTPG